ncbi:MAG: hypothetical protein ACE147_13265 [Candidatus Methylomirabilales bacterium]
MSSVQGYRCRECRTEIVASPSPTDPRGGAGWLPPVLCCGRPLVPVDSDQILPTMLSLRRFAWCPPCGHRVRLIVQPPGAMTCMVCRGSLIVVIEKDGKSPSRPAPQPALGRAG